MHSWIFRNREHLASVYRVGPVGPATPADATPADATPTDAPLADAVRTPAVRTPAVPAHPTPTHAPPIPTLRDFVLPSAPRFDRRAG